ncbi:DUF4259 domain-containing protein [Streptomyces sp. NPDC057499]|uniref:DUF4259 domain-containing protein n=1 Tax=Streptomyces sp. NPDC057499 TaxID=3346150 RepID=UPI003676439B
MGTWDIGHFDNDSAADFSGAVDDTPRAGREAVVREALAFAAEASEYLDSDEGAVAVAAAALVAAQCPGGEAVTTAYGPKEPLPDFAPELRPLAVRALDAVLGNDSELHELWDESGDKTWAAGIARLKEVLAAAPAG